MLTGAHRVVHANIALYAFCFWFTQPILPYISKDLGAGTVFSKPVTTAFAIRFSDGCFAVSIEFSCRARTV